MIACRVQKKLNVNGIRADMKELWCDFDGVIVSNQMHNINISNIASEEFADLVIEAYSKNPIVSPTAIRLFFEYQKLGASVNIVTGRKESCLSAITEKVIRDHALAIDKVFYYPEDYAYVMSDYYAWKASIIGRSAIGNQLSEIRVVDDDMGLLLHLKENLPHENLHLTHYEFFADGSEVMAHL
jgi:hypothetical protein